MEIPATKKSITKAAETIDLLNAEITKLTTEAKVLEEEIGKLQNDVATFESEKKDATAQREKDNKAYIEESTDYGESVDALDRAIIVLNKKPLTSLQPAQSCCSFLSPIDSQPRQSLWLLHSWVGWALTLWRPWALITH